MGLEMHEIKMMAIYGYEYSHNLLQANLTTHLLIKIKQVYINAELN